MYKWWKIQKSNFTAWYAHESIGDKIGLPAMVLGVMLSILFKEPWLSIVFFAYFLGNLNGYEICQNHLEQGWDKVKLWLETKIVDSLMDELVACYKSGIAVIIFLVVWHYVT